MAASALSQSALRAGLRAWLYDTVAPQVWSDAVLDTCILEAWAEHSYLFPWRTSTTLTLTPGVRPYAVEPITGPYADPSDGRPLADLINVWQVELPKGTVLPVDPRPASNPTGNRATRTGQGWWWDGTAILLTNLPAAGGPLGATIWITQTYIRPCDEVGALWNGPGSDVELLYLLAKRHAYQSLGEWQQRNLYVDPIDTKFAPVNVPAVLATLGTQIDTAITIRRRRMVASRALDI